MRFAFNFHCEFPTGLFIFFWALILASAAAVVARHYTLAVVNAAVAIVALGLVAHPKSRFKPHRID